MVKTKRYFAVVLVLVLVLGLATNGVAIAQDNSSSWPEAGLRQLFLEKLAANLGIEVSRLQEAMAKAGQQALDEGVASGLIDSSKAQRLQKAIGDGSLPWLAGPKRGVHVGRPLFGNDIATALGITPQELRQELQNGKTLEQIAAANGMTLEQLKEKLISNAKSKLDQAVASGELTRDKADKILNNLEQMDLSKIPRVRAR